MQITMDVKVEDIAKIILKLDKSELERLSDNISKQDKELLKRKIERPVQNDIVENQL